MAVVVATQRVGDPGQERVVERAVAPLAPRA